MKRTKAFFAAIALICLITLSANASKPEWLIVQQGCSVSQAQIDRFAFEIGQAREFFLDNVKNPERIRKIKIEFSCSPNAIGLASHPNLYDTGPVIIVSAGFLDTVERLGEAMYLSILTERTLHQKYPRYLARAIVSRQPFDEVAYPNELIDLTNQQRAKFNSKSGKILRKGFYAGIVMFGLGHEYAHIVKRHMEEGVRLRTNRPRNRAEAVIFQKQEYEADRWSSDYLSKGGIMPLVGIYLNQFMHEADNLGGGGYDMSSHPPALARSSFLVLDSILHVKTRADETQQTKAKQIKTLKLLQIEINEDIFNSLGPAGLRANIPDAEFESCLEELDDRCMDSCLNRHPHTKCVQFCSGERQHKSNMTRCYLRHWLAVLH